MTGPHYWVVVASRNHALRGIEEGPTQANYGHPGSSYFALLRVALTANRRA